MAYTKPKTWVDGQHQILASDLNRIEDGLVTVAASADNALTQSVADMTYLSIANANSQYYTRTQADGRFATTAQTSLLLPRAEAQSTYATQSALNGAVAGVALPVGTVLDYAGATAPAGFLLCQGQAVSRTTYSALFNVIGVAFGSGNGSTTFNVPPPGVVIVGQATSGTFNTRGATGGTETETLSLSQIPSHGHEVVQNNSANRHLKLYKSNAAGGSQWEIGSNDDSGVVDRFIAAATGGGQAHNNMPPYVVMPRIIKF